MPSAQMIDFNPSPRQEQTPLEKTIAGFASRARENQIDQADSDALRDIYKQHLEDGQNLERTIMEIQTRPGISPTTRVNSINQLMGMQKHNQQLQKQAAAQQREEAARKGKESSVRGVERALGLEEGALSAFNDNPALAERISRPPKEPKKTQASQPIDEDQLNRIQSTEALPEYQQANQDERARLLRNAGVSKENIDSIGKAAETTRADERVNRQQFIEDRNYHTRTSLPLVEKARSTIESEPAKKALIAQHRRDIDSGDVSGFGSFLVDKTGWEVFRNPASARARTASKQYFMQSLNDLASGARPNIFLEQQLSAGQTQIGRDEEANQAVLDIMEFTDDLKAQRSKYILEEAEKDREKYGYERNDIADRADRKMRDYAEQREDEMAYSIRKRHEDELSTEDLTKEIVSGKIPKGTPLTKRSAAILMIKNGDDERKAEAEAKRLGFMFPTEQTYMKGD